MRPSCSDRTLAAVLVPAVAGLCLGQLAVAVPPDMVSNDSSVQIPMRKPAAKLEEALKRIAKAEAAESDSRMQHFDPSKLVRFATPQQADAKRHELITYIWTTGLPTNALPAVTTNIGALVFDANLRGVDRNLAASVDKLNANVAPYGGHVVSYLIHSVASNLNNGRLVIYHSGHRPTVDHWAGGHDVVNLALAEGFTVLVMDMPLYGWNTNNTIKLANEGETITINNNPKLRPAPHEDMFQKLVPALPDGTIFRFFLDQIVQGINYFLQTNPGADVAMVGISGGGWTTTLASAVDVRIKRSFPVAGSYPLYCRTSPFAAFSHDIEQYYDPLFREADSNGDGITDTAAGVASWLEIYALGGYGPGRRQVQILNYYDTCCFFGGAFKTYTNFIASLVHNLGQGVWDFYSDTTLTNHWISSNAINQVIMPGLAGASGVFHKQRAGEGRHDSTMLLASEEWQKQANIPDDIAPITAPFPMPQLKRPVFSSRSFNILDFGAVADGTTKNTKAIADAIAACAKAGGGNVLVPAGKWLTGTIHLKSNVHLHLHAGSEIHFSDDPQDYLPVVFTRWAGFEVMNYSPLIYAIDCENIAVTGPGKLFGHGKKWWEWCKRLDEKNEVGPHLEEQVVKDIPLGERLYGSPGVGLRPQFISPINCRNVLLEGFTVAEPGPFWTIQFIYCENVIARGLSIHTKGGPNTDGINLDSTRNALIEYCLLDVGDDAVCLKSGINEDGRRVGKPTENVVVRNVTALSSHGGMVIGSDTSGGVRNVLAYDCVYDGSDVGIRLKSNASRGGVVENLYYRNITMRKVTSTSASGKPLSFRNCKGVTQE